MRGRSVEVRSKSVEEAVREGKKLLGVGPDSQVEVEVIEGGNRGFLGLLGSRGVLVKVTLKQDKVEFAKEFLGKIIKSMGVRGEVQCEQRSDSVVLNVVGEDVSALIGRYGRTLDAVQYLVNVAASRVNNSDLRVTVDVQGYRSRREENLRRLALRAAERVKRTGKSVVLDPMRGYERRVIHLTLQDDPEVMTWSEGEEPHRKIIVGVRKRQGAAVTS